MVLDESRNLHTLFLVQAVLQLNYPLQFIAGDRKELIVVGANNRLVVTPADSAALPRRQCAEGVIGKAWAVGGMAEPTRGCCEQRRSQSSVEQRRSQSSIEQRRSQSSVSTGNPYASRGRQSQDT